MQQHAIYHMNLFLQKDPADRQAEVDELGAFFPQYAALFRTQDRTLARGINGQNGSMTNRYAGSPEIATGYSKQVVNSIKWAPIEKGMPPKRKSSSAIMHSSECPSLPSHFGSSGSIMPSALRLERLTRSLTVTPRASATTISAGQEMRRHSLRR